jgi:hypothetical protein
VKNITLTEFTKKYLLINGEKPNKEFIDEIKLNENKQAIFIKGRGGNKIIWK